MAILTRRTGPGGTELFVRPGPSGSEHTACHLREAVEQTTRALAAVENALSEGLRKQRELALHHRQQFWMDTCRDVQEMRSACPQVMNLHKQHGCLFCVPTARQVQHILDALDSAQPGWEQDHAGLFYQTLELNFPELLRFCRAQRRC